MMNGICMRYASDEAQAADLLQESFITAFSKIDSYNGTGPLGGWLRRITINVALINYREKTAKRKLELVYTDGDENLVGDDSVFHKMDMEVLMKMIQELPIGFRTVFNLFAVEGYSHFEIAEELEITIGTSKSQYSRARVLLMKKIKKEEDLTKKRLNYAE